MFRIFSRKSTQVILVYFLLHPHALGNEMKILLDKLEANLAVNREIAFNLSEHAEELLAKNELFESFKPRLLNLQSHFFILSSDFNEAYEKAKMAEELAKESGNRLELAEAIRKQGIINFFLEFESEAIELLTKSLMIHQELQSDYVMNNLQSIANVYDLNDSWASSLIETGELLL